MKKILKTVFWASLLNMTCMSADVMNQSQIAQIGPKLNLPTISSKVDDPFDSYVKEWEKIKHENASKKGWLNTISPELFQQVNELYRNAQSALDSAQDTRKTKLKTVIDDIEQALIDKETVYVEERAEEWDKLKGKLDFSKIIENRIKEKNDPKADGESIEQEEKIEKIYNDLQEWLGFLYEDYSENFISENLNGIVKKSEEVSREIEEKLQFSYGE